MKLKLFVLKWLRWLQDARRPCLQRHEGESRGLLQQLWTASRAAGHADEDDGDDEHD